MESQPMGDTALDLGLAGVVAWMMVQGLLACWPAGLGWRALRVPQVTGERVLVFVYGAAIASTYLFVTALEWTNEVYALAFLVAFEAVGVNKATDTLRSARARRVTGELAASPQS